MDFGKGMELTALHIVVQTEGMSHFMKDQIMERIFNELRSFNFCCTDCFHGVKAKERGEMKLMAEGAELRITRKSFLFEVEGRSGKQSSVADLIREENVFQHDV